MIPDRESLTVEFKSDRKRLSDRELLEAVVCLANSEGGSIYLGVEDDGTVTGIHPAHKVYQALPAMIANRTVPSLTVRVEALEENGKTVLRIEVPKSRQVVATSDGVVKRRRMMASGTPECVPFLPHEYASRQAEFRQLDMSALPVPGAEITDLDPVQRSRLRQFIERNSNADRALLELDDERFDGALGFTVREGDQRLPTLTGLLLIGKEASLRRLVPTHEIAFQVLDGEEVRLNEFTRAPLIQAVEWLETIFKPLNPEQEMQIGLFRVAIPRLDWRAYREAIANALIHRDYSLKGAVHVRVDGNSILISNPGGLVEGVSIDNLLTTEPRPRNPALADACKRIGLVERTGRGVDLIYRGLLRYGRHCPDYSQTSASSVVLRLSTADADLAFLRLIVQEEQKRGAPLPIDSLIVLSVLREHRRMNREDLARYLQRDRVSVGKTLEAMVETGLVQPHGSTRGRTYTLSPMIYKELGRAVEYTRQAGFDRLQQEQLVRNFVKEHGSIRRQDVMDLCRLEGPQATRLLKRLVKEGVLERVGEKRGSHYVAGPSL